MGSYNDTSPVVRPTALADVLEGTETATPGWLEANLPLSLDAYEKAALERALVCSWGDAAEAARRLGIGRSTFYRKAGKHGIHLGGTRTASPAPVDEARRRDRVSPGVGPAKSLG